MPVTTTCCHTAILGLEKFLYINTKRSSICEFFVYGAGVFSAILSSVFINSSLPNLIEYLAGATEVVKAVTSTIFIDEVISIIIGILSILFIESFAIYAVTAFGFFFTSAAYIWYFALIKTAPTSTHINNKNFFINQVKICRGIYSIGNTLTLAVIFSSVHHVFQEDSIGIGLGSTLYGIISVLAAMSSALGISKLNILTSYPILLASQSLIVVLIFIVKANGGLKPTKPRNNCHNFRDTATYSFKFLIKNTLSKWLGLVAVISLSWAARTTSIVAYSYVKITLRKDDYTKFMLGHGPAQLIATVWYATLIGYFARRYSRFYDRILLLGIGIPGPIFAIISYGSFIFYSEETSLPINPVLTGFLAGASQIVIILYQMAFISELIISESKTLISSGSELLKEKELNGVRSAIVGLSSLFGSLGTFSFSLVAYKTLTTSNNDSSTVLSPQSSTKESLGLKTDKITTTSDSTIQTKFNRKSFWVIVGPCIVGLIADLGYRLSIPSPTQVESSKTFDV